MKKLLYLFAISVIFVSCVNKAQIDESVVVEQINVLDGQDFKYEVKLRTKSGSGEAYYYTNFRHQVGDTLISYYEFFESKNSEIRKLKRSNDSLKNELNVTKYYLEILKERVIIGDTLKRK